MIFTIDREFAMDRMKIKSEINKLLSIEEGILLKLAYESSHCSEEQLRYVSKKIFEISNMILILKRALLEFDDER
jgi:hypothetical protein|tara:strand:+ start:790 stop:1014 length:225 start_codon:yes stop_codon:yes gene_type:complete